MAYISKRKALKALGRFWRWLPKRAIVGTVIGGLIVLLIWEWRTGDGGVKGGERLTEAQCNQLRVAFHGRLKVFDAEYVFSRDSLGEILSRKYRQRTQKIPGEILKFWTPAKLRRDYIIDTFLAALEAKGCDTVGLHYTRHFRK